MLISENDTYTRHRKIFAHKTGTMEQLAHFVTKSFEYNNNRVLDVINMSTRSLICDSLRTANKSLSDRLSGGGASQRTPLAGHGNGHDDDDEPATLRGLADLHDDDAADDDNSMDIDITDISSDEEDAGVRLCDAIVLDAGKGTTDDRKGGAKLMPSAMRSDRSNTPAPMLLTGGCADETQPARTTVTTGVGGRDSRRLTTKNWLISDSPKRCSDGE